MVDAGPVANRLSLAQVDVVVHFMMTNDVRRGVRYLQLGPRGLICNLVPTKDASGNPKYHQMDCARFTGGAVGKVLVHHLVWRHETRGEIDPALHISHIDADKRYVRAIQETADMNESRKFCHLFGWFRALPGEAAPRCPHWDCRCTGPAADEE